MKKFTFISIAIILSQIVYSQQSHVLYYSNNKTHIEYTTNDGLLNGNYKSYYDNGNVKAEGTFKDNQKLGLWTVYDSKGNKRIERQYTNSMNFTTIKAWNENGKESKTSFSVKTPYDSMKEMVLYPTLKETDVVYSTRLLARIPDSGKINTFFYENNFLYYLLITSTINNESTAFKDEEFTKTIPIDSLKKLGVYNMTTIYLKEDYYYNKSMRTSEYRTIGLCAVVKDSIRKLHYLWFYYPEIRTALAKHITNSDFPSTIKNAENMFYFRYYNSSIIKVNNFKNQSIKDYKSTKSEINKEAERIEMETVDSEFQYWFQVNPIPDFINKKE